MPKALTDRDRILAFAFKATAEELDDAISTLKAARAAKGGVTSRKPSGKRTASNRKPTGDNKAADTGDEPVN